MELEKLLELLETAKGKPKYEAKKKIEAISTVESFLKHFNIEKGDTFVPFIFIYFAYYMLYNLHEKKLPKKKFSFYLRKHHESVTKKIKNRPFKGCYLNAELPLTDRDKEEALFMIEEVPNRRKKNPLYENKRQRRNLLRRRRLELKEKRQLPK